MLYVCREDWPEQAVLVAWVQAYARCLELSPDDLAAGRFRAACDALLARPVPKPLPQDGATLAAQEILALL